MGQGTLLIVATSPTVSGKTITGGGGGTKKLTMGGKIKGGGGLGGGNGCTCGDCAGGSCTKTVLLGVN